METQQELLEFHHFAQQRLSDGATGTLQELLDEWNTLHQHECSVAGIRESMNQYEAGLALPVNEAFEEIRTKLGKVK